jgi:hypothetical protein
MDYILHCVHYFTDSLFSKHVFASSLMTAVQKCNKLQLVRVFTRFAGPWVMSAGMCTRWCLLVCVPGDVCWCVYQVMSAGMCTSRSGVTFCSAQTVSSFISTSRWKSSADMTFKWHNIWTKVQHSQMYSNGHSTAQSDVFRWSPYSTVRCIQRSLYSTVRCIQMVILQHSQMYSDGHSAAQSDAFRWSLSTHKPRMLFTASGFMSSEMLSCDVWWVVPCMSPSSSDLQWFKVYED